MTEAMRQCVCQQKQKKTKIGAVLLTPLANLVVPFGAGACTLELCRVIWCGEYRSAVKVSTCNNPSQQMLLSPAAGLQKPRDRGSSAI
jgi:hypothetical protein